MRDVTCGFDPRRSRWSRDPSQGVTAEGTGLSSLLCRGHSGFPYAAGAKVRSSQVDERGANLLGGSNVEQAPASVTYVPVSRPFQLQALTLL